MRFPFSAAEAELHGAWQRAVQRLVASDVEEAARGIVDQVRELVDVLVDEVPAGVKQQLALDFGHAGKLAENDQAHESGIDEIPRGSIRGRDRTRRRDGTSVWVT